MPLLQLNAPPPAAPGLLDLARGVAGVVALHAALAAIAAAYRCCSPSRPRLRAAAVVAASAAALALHPLSYASGARVQPCGLPLALAMSFAALVAASAALQGEDRVFRSAGALMGAVTDAVLDGMCKARARTCADAGPQHGQQAAAASETPALPALPAPRLRAGALAAWLRAALAFDAAAALFAVGFNSGAPSQPGSAAAAVAAALGDVGTRLAATCAAGCVLAASQENAYRGVRLVMLAAAPPAVAAKWAAAPATLTDKPWLSTSLGEWWGSRWHQALRTLLERGAALVDALLPRHGWLAEAQVRSAARTLAAFTLSGLTHAYWFAAMGHWSWDLAGQLGFFTIHAAACVLEQAVGRAWPGAGAALPAWLKRAAVLAFLVWTAPLLGRQPLGQGELAAIMRPPFGLGLTCAVWRAQLP